ncbi:MAG: coenzyme F420-0:L-glutamate ligase [Emcibacter sp.]|nr:coenzyme F420-0:L-glutamate ligase [Emcibacter sp.]
MPTGSTQLSILALSHIPMINRGDDLGNIILDGLIADGFQLEAGDVIILAQKIVSKAEGRVVDLTTVTPSPKAVELAHTVDKDPRLVELILRESSEVVRTRKGVLIVAHKLGFILANAGIDHSNVDQGGKDKEDMNQEENILLLPEDPDTSCQKIRDTLTTATGIDIPVMIIDSIGRAWRNGTVGISIGISGLPGVIDLRGEPDLAGTPLQTSELGYADEVAAAASLMMGQGNEGCPVIVMRGLPYGRRNGHASELIRPREMDLFR